MEKILYVVKTTQKHGNRISAILNTWLSGDEDYIFISDHEDLEKNIILTSDDSSYEGVLKKSLFFYNNLNNIKCNGSDVNILDYYDWILSCDDDTFVNTKMVRDFLKKCDKNDLLAYCVNVSPDKYPGNPVWSEYSHIFKDGDCYFSGGGGILISSCTLKKVNNFVDYGNRFDDVAIGLHLHRSGVKLIDCSLFHSTHPEFYGHTDSDIINSITYHHISHDRMYDMYNYIK